MKIENQPKDQFYTEAKEVERSWWESGSFTIHPEKKFGIAWGVIKNAVIFVSFFTLSYNAGNLFKRSQSLIIYEMFFDSVQVIDILLTCITAKRSRDISDATRQYFKSKDDKIKAVM